jgi:hypothetical protein
VEREGRLRFIILQLLVVMAFGAQAATVDLAGRRIEVPVPAEYCQFGKRLVDIELARNLLSELGNDNQVLAFFADCDELDAYRHRRRSALDNFGLVFAQRRNGNSPVPIGGRSRPEFIKDMGGVVLSDRSDVVKLGEAHYKLALARGKLSLRSQQPFHLQADSNGAYFGIVGQLTASDGKPSNVLGVLGITLVKEMFLSIEIYQRVGASPPIEDLLERQQAAMAKLVEANQ